MSSRRPSNPFLIATDSKDEYTPEQKLVGSIIWSGVVEADVKYFYSETFEEHCKLLNLDADNVRSLSIREIRRKPE